MPVLKKCKSCNGEMFFASDGETVCKHCGETMVTRDGKFVLSTEEAEAKEAKETIKAKEANTVAKEYGKRQVVITDVQMPFWSMVVFMVKASIAFIPAFIILAIIYATVGFVLFK